MNKTEKLAYLVGRLEERATLISLGKGRVRVSFRTSDFLPRELKKRFGGTCFKHGSSLWYRVQGPGAIYLLQTIFPYLVNWKKKVQKLLDKNSQAG